MHNFEILSVLALAAAGVNGATREIQVGPTTQLRFVPDTVTAAVGDT